MNQTSQPENPAQQTTPAPADKHQPANFANQPNNPAQSLNPANPAPPAFPFNPAIAALFAPPTQKPQKDIPALHTVFPFKLGVAIQFAHISDTNPYHDLLRHFSALVYENDTKPILTQPTEGDFQFSHTDALVEYGQKTNKIVRGHTLLWHNQTPDWFFQAKDENGNFIPNSLTTKEELYSRIKTHIQTLVSHYKGKIDSWDVVNECLNDDRTIRNSKYYQIIGSEEFIANAFRWAHQADPNAKLILNDYNLEFPGPKQDAFFDLVQRLRTQGVPIDGVGFQGHISLYKPTIKQFQNTIQRFGKAGFKVQITELEISVYKDEKQKQRKPTKALLTRQAKHYKKLFQMFITEYNASHLDMVIVWGLTDNLTWLNFFPVMGRRNYPLFFDDNLQAKPAYWTFIDKKHPIK